MRLSFGCSGEQDVAPLNPPERGSVALAACVAHTGRPIAHMELRAAHVGRFMRVVRNVGTVSPFAETDLYVSWGRLWRVGSRH